VVAASLIIAVPVVHPPAVTSTIGYVEVGTAEVEIVAMRIAGVDAEVPVACIPDQRTIEIGSSTEQIPLPGEKNVAQIQITALPVGTEYVVLAGDSHEVVEVYLIGGLILSIAQV
jgi:hypothetical protein